MTPRRIAIVGAGMTGLACAHRLLVRAGSATGGTVDVRVFDAAPRAGGHAHTTKQDGFLIEAGPNGWLGRYEAPRAMVEELGLAGELVHAGDAAKRRFVVRDGRLRRAPDSPVTLLTSDALSPGAVGSCVPLCDTDEDCERGDYVCRVGSPVAGRRGICDLPLDADDGAFSSEPPGGSGSSGDEPDDGRGP